MATSPSNQTPAKPGRFGPLSVWWHGRRLSILANAWGLSFGILAMFAAISYFVDPDSIQSSGGSLVATLGNWVFLWNVLYLLGGAGMTYGILCRNRAVDMAGLCILATALLINAVCILFVQKGFAGSAVPSLVGFAVAALARVRALYLLGQV